MARGSNSGTPQGRQRDTTDPTRVALIAPDCLYRDAIELYVREQVWLELVGVATQKNGADRLLARADPDLVILRDRVALERVGDAAPKACFVLMEIPESSKDAERLLQSRAAGFIWPDMDRQTLELTLTVVARGHTLLPPGLTSVPPGEPAASEDSARDHPDLQALTAREMEVLPLMGSTNNKIADELDIKVSTVRTHVHHILKKLGVSSRAEAVMVYLRPKADA